MKPSVHTASEPVELLPCPFCGAAIHIRKGVNGYGHCKTEGCHASRAQIVSLDDQKQVAAWNRRALTAAPVREEGGAVRRGVYVASRASAPERPAMWRNLRAQGHPIISTWIDEAGEGESHDLGDLWGRILREVTSAQRLVLYAEAEDFPLKGAYVEVGMALAAGVPVFVVAPGVALDARSLRPLGSWAKHPLVTFCDTVEEAFAALATREEAPAELSGNPGELAAPICLEIPLSNHMRVTLEYDADGSRTAMLWNEANELIADGAAPILTAQPRAREEAQLTVLPTDETGQITKRFVIFTTPGEVPEKKGGWLKDEHLIDFLRAVMLHDGWKPGFRATVLELTWDNDLWASSASEYLEIHDDAIGPRRARKAWQAARDEHERIYKVAPTMKLGDEIASYRRIAAPTAPESEMLRAAVEALEPFAERALRYVPIPGVWSCADDVEIWQLARNEGMEADITVGHLRRAAQALAALQQEAAEPGEAEDEDPHAPCAFCGEEHPVGVLDADLCPACGDEEDRPDA